MRKMLQKLTLIALFAFISAGLFAQGTVTGKIKDDMTGEPLIGASVVLDGTTTGATTDMDGVFTLDLPSGTQKIVISYVGYENVVMDVDVANGETTSLGKIILEGKAIGMAGLEIIADRAKERETPVAISNVSKQQLQENLGSRDLPMVMNNTPSVYATPQGGGAGDARINVRGFDQRNVAIMINGVPVNDMENGWVYWSNWDGVADATSSIQMQRGLSAINLATPSVGGTMNILTDPAAHKAGGSAKFEVGSGGFLKGTFSGHSGLINEKFAVSASVVHKRGNGIVDATWTNAWAYYLGAAYNVNKNHRLELYAVGATQRHGQNLYKQNVAMYSHDYAKEIGADDSLLIVFDESPNGRLYNENWNYVSESYTGQQSWNNNGGKDRYKSDIINERENYYHKPLANLNWYAQWSEKLTQFTTVYYSGGTGGGSGTAGSIKYDYDSEPTRIADWDATIANNQDPANEGSYGILRNSANNQWTIGAISKIKIDFSERFKMQVGVDWRTAQIEHYREVRDLLGAPYFIDNSDEFASTNQKGLGDKIYYFNTNTVDWLGGFVQAEYKTEKFSIYGTGGYSGVKYGYTNHFAKDESGNEITSKADWIGSYQIKGGGVYNFTETFSAFANLGFISKVPIFDNVINDGTGQLNENPLNERFNSYEAGLIFNTIDDKLKVKANFYYTNWLDRTLTRYVQVTPDQDGYAFISNLDQRHTGFELEFNYRPVRVVGVGGIASFANWVYLNDVNATIQTYDEGSMDYVEIPVDLYVKDLKVGDAPQTQFAAWVDIFPVDGLKVQIIFRHNANHYAQFEPTSRTDETDREQVWKTPSYSVLDAHINYTLPLKGKLGIDLFAHFFNLTDAMYIQDAVDNSSYNGFYGYDNRFSHTVNSAEVYLGLPFNFNAGVKVSL